MRIPWWQSMEWRTYRLPSFVDWAECRHPMCVSMFRSFRGPLKPVNVISLTTSAFFFHWRCPKFPTKTGEKIPKTVITSKEDSLPQFFLKKIMDFPQKIPGSSLVVALRSWWIDLERKSSCSTQRWFGLCCSTSVWSPRWTASLPLKISRAPEMKGVFQASFFQGRAVKFQGCAKTAKKSRGWNPVLTCWESWGETWYFLWKGISLILEGPHFYFLWGKIHFGGKDMGHFWNNWLVIYIYLYYIYIHIPKVPNMI